MNDKIDWRKFTEDNKLSSVEFEDEVILATIAVLSLRLDNIDEKKCTTIRGKYLLTLEEIVEP